ncbi:hypothetical protein ACLMAL_37445 [Nocardia sp. CWNU-33]
MVDEDVARLTAYVLRHVHVHGPYSFRCPTSAALGARYASPTT